MFVENKKDSRGRHLVRYTLLTFSVYGLVVVRYWTVPFNFFISKGPNIRLRYLNERCIPNCLMSFKKYRYDENNHRYFQNIKTNLHLVNPRPAAGANLSLRDPPEPQLCIELDFADIQGSVENSCSIIFIDGVEQLWRSFEIILI